jgi:hypothetical protein
MSINPPRISGPYLERATDCEFAIERDFLRETVNATTHFLDLDRVLTEIAEDAMRVGWSEQELTDAVLRLAVRYHMKPTPKRSR